VTRTEYATYLLSPEWQRRRAERVRFAGGRCELCFGIGRIEVHHRTYERVGAELLTDLIALCEGCHERFHQAPVPAALDDVIVLLGEWVAVAGDDRRGEALALLEDARSARVSRDAARIAEIAARTIAAAEAA
jgi:hypothetical protein